MKTLLIVVIVAGLLIGVRLFLPLLIDKLFGGD